MSEINVSEVLNLDSLMEHVNSDVELLSELVEIFGDYYPDHLTSIRSAIATGDCSDIRETAHQLKGAVSNFHAPCAVAIARQMEDAGRDGQLELARACCDQLCDEIERMYLALQELCQD
jgi:HPt (histidine-containing phosphotransfer) domain-containing protein